MDVGKRADFVTLWRDLQHEIYKNNVAHGFYEGEFKDYEKKNPRLF